MFTVIPYWTGAPCLVAVALFGLLLLLVPLVTRTWTRRVVGRTVVAAVIIYVVVSFAPALTGADTVDDAGYAAEFLLFFVLLAGSVAAGG